MEIKLTAQEIELLLESLKYTKQNFETYQGYPSADFKKQRLELVEGIVEKLKAAKN